MFWRKPGILILDLYLYSIKIQNQYWSKYSKIFAENHIFFKRFLKNFFFGLGPTRPVWLGWTQPPRVAGLDLASPAWSLAQASDPTSAIHAHVIFYACMNNAKVIKLTSYYSSSFLQMARTEPWFCRGEDDGGADFPLKRCRWPTCISCETFPITETICGFCRWNNSSICWNGSWRREWIVPLKRHCFPIQNVYFCFGHWSFVFL